MNKFLLRALIGLVLFGGIVIIMQIWGVHFGPDVFLRIIGTVLVLMILIGFLLVVKIDFGEHKRLKDENYLD